MEKARILIVEDELLVARNIADKLYRAGYQVAGIAVTSEEAVQIAAQTGPDLIVIDVQLEGDVDGIQVAGQIQAQMDVPILYLTAHAGEAILKRARLTTPFGYILKPFHDHELFSNIEIALYKHEMERKMRAREAELDAIFNGTTTIMALVDRERRVRRANRAAWAAGDWSAEVVVELRVGDMLRCLNALRDPRGCGWGPACGQCVVRRTTLDTLETGRAHHQVPASLTITSGDCAGERALLVSTSLLDVNGESLALVCLDDVTPLKQAQDVLAQERRLLRTVIDNLPDAIYAKDTAARKTLANRVDVENICARSEAEVLGKSDWELFPPEVAQAFYANDQHVLQTGQPILDHEELLVSGTGRPIWLRTSKLPLRDPEGCIVGLVGIGRDITAQKKAEEALRQSEEQYRALFETMQEAFALHEIILDEQGVPSDYSFLQVNPAFERLTGLRAADIAGKSVRQAMSQVEPYWIETYGRVALGGEPIRFENYASALDRYFEVLAFSPGPGRFATVFIDITERKRAEEELRRTTQLLDSVRQAQSLYIAQEDPQPVFDALLRTLLSMTGSEFGFLDEVLHHADGTPYKRSLAISNIAWDSDSRALYEQLVAHNLEFRNLNNLAGLPAVLREPVITNNAGHDPRSAGLPAGHPPIQAFMGLPVWAGGEIVGVIGVANRPGGYDDKMTHFLEPYLNACAGIIQAIRLRSREREAVSALRESEERFHDLFEQAPLGYQSLDEEGHFIEVNQAWLSTMGYSREEVIGKWFGDFLAPGFVPAFRERFPQFKAAGKIHAEFQMLRKNGERRFIAFEGRIGHTATGDFKQTHCILQDVTERKRAEQALRQSEETLNEAQEIAGIGSYIWDLRTDALQWSRHMLSIAGLDPDAFYGNLQDTINRLIHPDDRASVQQQVADMVTQKRTWSMEFRLVRPDGEMRWLRSGSRFELDEQGRPVVCVGVHYDITERKQADAERERLLAQMQQLITVVPEGVIQIDHAGRVLMANPAARRDLQVLCEAGEHEVLRSLGGHPLADVLTWSGENAWHEIQASGRTFEVAAKAMPRSAGWVLLIRDMSREREMQAHIRQQDRLAVIGQLAGGVAHDFNNILTAIKGYASLVADELPEDEPIHADVDEIKIAADRAAALTTQLLVFSRKQIVRPQALNLNTVIINMDKMLRRIIGEQVDLQARLDPAIGQVLADLSQTEQVVLNLCVNARDAMPGGGQLLLSTQNVVLSAEQVARHLDARPGSFVLLTVRDSGVGMRDEVRVHLFEPFFTTKEMGKGTGLGLSTVYGIVKQAGGHIEVESQVGKGTTFRIYLPRVESPAAADTLQASTGAPQGGTETILLVEDEDLVRELAVRVLERYGYTVLAARLPQQALALMQDAAYRVSLLVTDVIMPAMSGPELARRLIETRPGLRVIYMSGYTDDELSHHGVLAPGVVLLPKPFDPRELVQVARKVLDAPGAG